MNKKTCNLVNATPQYHRLSKKQNIPPSVPQDTQEPLNATLSHYHRMLRISICPLLTSTISMASFLFMCRYENVLVKEIKIYL